MRRTVSERFWAMVPDRPDGDCWTWTGHIDTKGYGVIQIDRRKNTAYKTQAKGGVMRVCRICRRARDLASYRRRKALQPV